MLQMLSISQDLGEEPLRDEETVAVHVTDVDDLDPFFEPPSYSIDISENSTFVSWWPQNNYSYE